MTHPALVACFLSAFSPPPPDPPLPTSLAAEVAEAEADPDGLFPTLEPAQDRLARSRRRPFFDFEHSEVFFFLGITQYSSAFDADPSFAAGIQYRVPLPRVGGLGIFAEAAFSAVDRGLNPTFYDKLEGNFFVFGGGLDYTLVNSERFLLRPQVGALYVLYDDIAGIDDGFGLLLGGMIGVHWVHLGQTVSLVYNPQWLADGDDWILFHNVGINIAF